MKVKDIMVREVDSLLEDVSVREAMDILFKRQISGLPVINNDGKLIGMFTEKEVLAYLLPSYVQQVGRFIYEENPKATKNKLLALGKIKVSELMRKEVVTTGEEVTLCETARIILTQKARRLPVVDKTGKIVGMVARCDVLRAMIKDAEDTLN